MALPQLFRFPDPVNEVSARLVAGGVLVLALVTLIFQLPWLLILLAYGFVARVLTGPTLSPLGQFVTRVVVPRLPVAERPVPGPPKRFAQGIGAVVTVTAALLYFGFGEATAASVFVGLIVVAASLESLAGICIGCRVFSRLMRFGIVPQSVCEACNDISSRRPVAAGRGAT